MYDKEGQVENLFTILFMKVIIYFEKNLATNCGLESY